MPLDCRSSQKASKIWYANSDRCRRNNSSRRHPMRIARYIVFEGLPGTGNFSGILKQAEAMQSRPRPAMPPEKLFANLRLSYEAGSQPGTKAMGRAYLHDPDGVVSVETALEIGMAKALGTCPSNRSCHHMWWHDQSRQDAGVDTSKHRPAGTDSLSSPRVRR